MLQLVTHTLARLTATLADRTDKVPIGHQRTARTFVLTLVGLLLLVKAMFTWCPIAGWTAAGLACFVLELCMAAPTPEESAT